MVVGIPIWMALVRLIQPIAKGPLVEIALAGVVAVVAAQVLYFDLFWQNFILPTVDPSTKGMMLLWYVATVSNYMLATLAAILFCVLQGIWLRRKPRIVAPV